MLTQVVVPVPTAGASTWVASTIKSLGSVGLSFGAQPSDSVLLCGSNDNTVTVTSVMALEAYAGFGLSSAVDRSLVQYFRGASPCFVLGAFLYYAVIRTGGATAGLNFNLVGGA